MLVCICRSGRHAAVTAPTPLGIADFVGGTYSWGGTSLAASDVITHTDWLGAAGLQVPASAAAGAQLLNQFGAKIATCDWTVVIDVETLSLDGTYPPALILTADNAGEAFYIEVAWQAEWDLFDSDDTSQRALFNDDGLTIGTHRIALTRTNDNLAMSVDGGAVITNLSNGSGPASNSLPVPGFPMVNIYLGGWWNNTGKAINIRRLAIYDAKINSLLPVLSAP